jgi:acyl-CoA reductase-like NAD-dependent aldehyde dehydrogenase
MASAIVLMSVDERSCHECVNSSCFWREKWVGTKSGTVIDDINPATGTGMAKVHTAGPAEIETAIAAAAAAQKSWAFLPGPEKKEVFYKAAAYLDKHMDRFVDLLIDESGSPYMKAFAELDDCKAIFLEGVKTVDLVTGKVLHTDTSNQHSYFIRQPRGVVGAIAPVQLSGCLALFKITYGLACGNAVILKPSSRRLSAERSLQKFWEAAGLPKGVFSVRARAGGHRRRGACRDCASI